MIALERRAMAGPFVPFLPAPRYRSERWPLDFIKSYIKLCRLIQGCRAYPIKIVVLPLIINMSPLLIRGGHLGEHGMHFEPTLQVSFSLFFVFLCVFFPP